MLTASRVWVEDHGYVYFSGKKNEPWFQDKEVHHEYFTGFTDITGTMIYQGDIILFDFPSGKHYSIVTPVNSASFQGFNIFPSALPYAKIVGNIHTKRLEDFF